MPWVKGHDRYRVSQGAGAMRRHSIDRDEQIDRRYSGNELVERDLMGGRIDHAGGESAAGAFNHRQPGSGF
jgi:hypothetical protein